MKFVHSPESVSDSRRVRKFISATDLRAARRVAASITQEINQIKTIPLMGIEVLAAPDPESVRDLVLGKYIVRYLVQNGIFILRIWHHMEDRE